MFDAHCHLQEFTDEEIASFVKAGLSMICCGGDVASSRRAAQIANSHQPIYATAGVHPEHLDELKSDTFVDIEKLLHESKVVAVGECGLDYTDQTTNSQKVEQQKLLMNNLELAKKYNLPLVVHCRNAFDDIFKIIDYPFVQLHCFTGNKDQAGECINRGWYLSFGGILTFKSSQYLRDLISNIPTDKLLIETDSPYLAPEPLRGGRNNPKNVKIIAEELAQLVNLPLGDVITLTTQNTKNLFKL